MANVLINEDTMTDIADAIRSKKGVSITYKPNEMPSAIESISGGGVTPTGTINITTNGTHDVTNYASASVAVPQGTTPTGTKEISIISNGTTTEDVTNYASARITVNVPSSGGSDKIPVFGPFYLTNNATTASKIQELNNVVKVKRYTNAMPTLSLVMQKATMNNATYQFDIEGTFKIEASAFSTTTNASALGKITCEDDQNAHLYVSGAGGQIFRGNGSLTEIHPAIDFSGATAALSRWTDNSGLANLVYMRCVPNSLKYGLGLSTCSKLSNESLVSIANALQTGTTATLTLHATAKTNCASITGTVSSVTEDEVTYDFFTADANGTVTLTDFITTTKGWTLA